MEKIVDPFFLYQMGLIKPKNHFTPLSLQRNMATRQTVKHFFKGLSWHQEPLCFWLWIREEITNPNWFHAMNDCRDASTAASRQLSNKRNAKSQLPAINDTRSRDSPHYLFSKWPRQKTMKVACSRRLFKETIPGVADSPIKGNDHSIFDYEYFCEYEEEIEKFWFF